MNKFIVRPEYILKYSINTVKWSLLVAATSLLLGLFVLMFLATKLYDYTSLVYIGYVTSYSLVGFLTLYLVLLMHNYILKRIYFYVDDKFLLLSSLNKTKILIDKLKKIEITRDSETDKCIILNFYSSQIFVFGGVTLGDEMFDLEPILQDLKSLDTIPQEVWVEKMAGGK